MPESTEPVLVTLETSAGDLVLELSPADAPETVANVLTYVRAGFYAGTVFHRVIKGFVAQTGGYTLDHERKKPLRPPIRLERSPLRHTDGAIGMARLPEPNTATSEFYFCDGAQPELNGDYCVFGRLIAGRETLRRILSVPTKADNWPTDPPIVLRAYEGRPDPANPAPKYVPPAAPEGIAGTSNDPAVVRAAAKKLRGRAALLRARKPLMAMSEVETAIAQADRSGRQEDLKRAEELLLGKERR